MTRRAGLAFKPWTAQGERVQNEVVRAAVEAIADKCNVMEDEAKVRAFVAKWVKNNYCGAKRRATAHKAARQATNGNGDDDDDAPPPSDGEAGADADAPSAATAVPPLSDSDDPAAGACAFAMACLKADACVTALLFDRRGLASAAAEDRSACAQCC